MLMLEGIVVTPSRSWAVVREFSMKDIRDFGEVRTVFEPWPSYSPPSGTTRRGPSVSR